MGVIVYTNPVNLKYKTVLCSKATAFYLICTLLTIIPPLLVAYRSEGFWKKIDVYREQPDIHYEYELVLLLETDSGNLGWSTYHGYNELLQEQARVPTLKSSETDMNRDGRNDKLDFELTMPLTEDENVYGIKLFVLFDVKLYQYSAVHMEGLAFVSATTGLSATGISVTGDLSIIQKQPFAHAGRDNRYSRQTSPVFTDSLRIVPSQETQQMSMAMPYVEQFKFDEVLNRYNQRNVTTRLTNDYLIWERGGSPASGFPFTVKLTVNYPTQTLTYHPGFWQMMKWAWIQYLSIFIVFVYLMRSIKTFVYTRQVLPTREIVEIGVDKSSMRCNSFYEKVE